MDRLSRRGAGFTIIELSLVLIVLGITLVTVLWFGDLLATRFLRLTSPLEASSIQERLVDYGQAWSLIRTVPIKGVGAGYYIPALWAGVGEERPPGFRRVHNTPLLVCAELGVGGLVLWLWLLLSPPFALFHWWQDLSNRGGIGWAAAFLCAAVLGLFDSYLYVPSTWWPALFIGFIAGTWARSLLSAREQQQ